jgi:hypothetical protein
MIKDITVDEFASEGLSLLRKITVPIVVLWVMIIIGIRAEFIIPNPISSVIMIFLFLFVSIILLSSIYITERNPIYGIVNMVLLLVILYTLIPFMGSTLEAKWGTLFISGYKISKIWGFYAGIVKLIVISTIVFGFLKFLAIIHELLISKEKIIEDFLIKVKAIF